jgi:Dolichyl-phosphate-mannose-protein mannosyltransferase
MRMTSYISKSGNSDKLSMHVPIEVRDESTIIENLSRLEPFLLLILSIAFLAFSPPRIHLTLLNAIHHSELWEKRSEAISQLGIFYSLAFLFLAISSFICIRREGTTLTSRAMTYLVTVPGAMRDMTDGPLLKSIFPRRGEFWLVAAMVLGIGIRVCFMNSPMKWDESSTFFSNIQSPLPYVFEYLAPNNHVLNSILERISTLILGKHPISIRLPAFLAGVASIPLMFRVCRTLTPGKSGYFAAAAVAIWPYLIFYSANGRGYSLVVFLSLILILVSFEFVNHPTRGGVGLIAITSALELFTMPSTLFMVVGAGAWIAWLLFSSGHTRRSILFEFVIPCAVLTIALTALLYTPVVLVSNGFEHILHNRFVQPQPWHEFFQQSVPHLRATVGALASGIPKIALVAIAILIAAGLYTSARNRNWPVFVLLPLILGASAIILIAQHRIPFERTWIFFVPLILLVADAGFTRTLEIVPPRSHSAAIGALFLLMTILGLRLITSYPATGYSMKQDFPEARLAAQFLKPMFTEGDAVRASLTAEEPTFFYLWYDTSVLNPRTHKAIKPQPIFYMGDQEFYYSFMWYHKVNNPRLPVTTEPHRIFYVLKKSECTLDTLPNIHIFLQANETLDLPAKAVIKILDYGDMAIYRQADPQDQLAAKN